MRPLRIGILGGGPAGLYAAVLLKNANPAHEITVIERNPAGATFGFGVVLSDRTLTAFREADARSYDEITAHQATWEAIETIHRGVRVRCGGHYYLGIGRKRLLEILQRRAGELGVKMQFQTEVTSHSVFDGCDLIIAADGVNSLTRRTYADALGATAEWSQSKYIWLGVEYIPTAFTFIFHETEHGLFQAHMYPYDERTSTCIVQCRDSTWRRAGLDKLDEAGSVQFCQELLAPYLGNARFLSNRSLWSTFQTVRARKWSHGNLVLLGDAIHTAHWSIGCGTKLAMEDAIALVKNLQEFDDIPTALARYELERKPVVERFQQAGRVSELYCENAERFMHLEPIQFAFQLMIRSRRLDYENLKQRDPEFIAAVDRWFADRAAAEAGTAGAGALPPCQSPVRIGDLVLQNRIVHAPPSGPDTGGGAPAGPDADGTPAAADLEGIRALAADSPGLVLTGVVAVSPQARRHPGSAGLYAGGHLAAWQRLVAEIRARSAGTRVGVQLGYAAGTGSPDPGQVREEFARAARMAAEAGFDLLQLDMTAGSLLGSSLAPAANAFPLAVLAAVRGAWPAGKPLAAALTVAGGPEGGLSADEATALARQLREHGCDLIHVLAGAPAQTAGAEAAVSSEQIRNEAGIPTMTSACSSGEANTLVAGARADLCVLQPARLAEVAAG